MVDEETSKLPMINNNRGLYSFNPLQFWCKETSSVFQKIMDNMLAELDFVMAYLDEKWNNWAAQATYERNIFKS